MRIRMTSVGVIRNKFLGYNSNQSGLLNRIHRLIINLNTTFPNQIEPTLLKDVHRYPLQGQPWNLGLIRPSSIQFDPANQCLGSPIQSLESGRWIEGLKANHPTVVWRITDRSGVITILWDWDREMVQTMLLCLIDQTSLTDRSVNKLLAVAAVKQKLKHCIIIIGTDSFYLVESPSCISFISSFC